ncbi:hypothetical protein ACUNI3_26400, partial [Serratia sp. IR-2025]
MNNQSSKTPSLLRKKARKMAYRLFGGMNGYATQYAETSFREKRDRTACFCRSANVRNGERAGNSLHGREALAKPAARQWGSTAPALPPPFDDRRLRRGRMVLQTQ